MLKSFYLLLPYWIVSYYLWTSIPTRLVSILWFGTIYLFAAVFIATKGKRILFILSKDPWIVALIILSGLSWFWSVDTSITFASFRSLIVQYILVGYLVATYSLKQIIGFISKILCGTGILSFLYLIFLPGIAIRSPKGGEGSGSWQGIFLHQSVLAATMALAIVSLLYAFLLNREKIRSNISGLWILVVAAICLYLLLFCGAKTSLVGCFASFSILPFFYLRQIRGMKTRNLIFMLLTYVFCIGIPLVYLFQEFIIVDILGKNATLSGRSQLWEYLYSQALYRPFGYGLDAFWHNEKLVRGTVVATDYAYGNSHSSYYDLLIGIGFPGMVLLFFCVINVIRKTIVLAFHHNQLEFQWASQVIIIILIASYADSFIGFLKPRTIGWLVFCIISLTSSLELARLKKPEFRRHPRTYLEVKTLLQTR